MKVLITQQKRIEKMISFVKLLPSASLLSFAMDSLTTLAWFAKLYRTAVVLSPLFAGFPTDSGSV